jgi:8-amino-7-oxononanoate synthase
MSINRRSWEQKIADELSRLRESHLYRSRRVTRPIDATHVERDGRTLVNFASNNYLGLTHHPKVIAAVAQAAQRDGAGSGAAPLVSGYGPAQQSAEAAIARWKGTEEALLLPSGYQANHAAIQAVAMIGKLQGGVRFLVDKLAHASLIDAIRATGEPFRIYPHQHLAKLRRLLEEHAPDQLQVVVTESIFSMDGDAADLRGLAQLKAQHEFFLLLDEAHASGVYGPTGNGLAAELGVQNAVDATVLTLSKAMGGIGGAVCGSTLLCEAVVNFGRAYLFSTGVPPAVAAGAQAAVEVIVEEPQRRERVRELSRRVRSEFNRAGLNIPMGDSPIIPILLGKESAALEAAEKLESQGLLVVAIRPPTVARGSSRLRITLSSQHSDAEIDRLLAGIASIARGA